MSSSGTAHDDVPATGAASELRIPVPWGHLAAKAWGPSEGHPVLCLHGWMDNANSFQRLVPLLPPDHRYIALEFSGHGRSSHLPPGSRSDFKNYLIEVRRLVEAMKWSQVSIIGHSMGGIVGCMFAYMFPEMVDRLVLVDSYGFLPFPVEKLLDYTRNLIHSHLKLEQKINAKVYSPDGALRRLLEANKALTEESARILLERGTKEVPGGVVYSRDIQVSVHYDAFFTLEQCLAFLQDIRANVLTIMASDGLDKTTQPPSLSEALRSNLVQGFKSSLKERYQLEMVQGNHFVHLNEPQNICGIISNFLQQEPSRSISIQSRL